jgi:hypothetical protein
MEKEKYIKVSILAILNMADKKRGTTTIQISYELKEKLDKLGSKNETYEQIIDKLIKKK